MYAAVPTVLLLDASLGLFVTFPHVQLFTQGANQGVHGFLVRIR
jgi:hypothetical protein